MKVWLPPKGEDTSQGLPLAIGCIGKRVEREGAPKSARERGSQKCAF